MIIVDSYERLLCSHFSIDPTIAPCSDSATEYTAYFVLSPFFSFFLFFFFSPFPSLLRWLFFFSFPFSPNFPPALHCFIHCIIPSFYAALLYSYHLDLPPRDSIEEKSFPICLEMFRVIVVLPGFGGVGLVFPFAHQDVG